MLTLSSCGSTAHLLEKLQDTFESCWKNGEFELCYRSAYEGRLLTCWTSLLAEGNSDQL
jgi:hypothetical protein